MNNKPQTQLNIIIDGNESNVQNRVGSNVYAYELIRQFHKYSLSYKDVKFTVALSSEPQKDMPNQNNFWHYQVIKPKKLWTQWAFPIYLYKHRKKYDCLFNPGHYAPRISPIPYITSLMDLAYLEYPQQFRKSDYLQLKYWTQYSVKNANKVLAISQFTKQQAIKHYKLNQEKIFIAYPGYKHKKNNKKSNILEKHGINKNNYFLFVGTLQPRKNLIRLIKSFEIFSRSHAASKLGKKKYVNPQLVIAGKIGWLADDILDRIKQSPFKKQIILTDYIKEHEKQIILKYSKSLVLIGLYEGFGIPALEAMHYHKTPVVSDSSSLPEVVGEAGVLVKPKKVKSIVYGLKKAWNLSSYEKTKLKKIMNQQTKKFSWKKSADTILEQLKKISNKHETNQNDIRH